MHDFTTLEQGMQGGGDAGFYVLILIRCSGGA